MEAIILDNTPISGEYPEVNFGGNYYNGIWVKFVDSNYEMWVGHFPGSDSKVSDKVLVSHDKKTAFVLSGSRGYIIDINARELKYKTDEGHYIQSLIQTSSPDYFIASTYSSVCIFDENKMIKELFPNFPEFDVEGMYVTSQKDNYVLGSSETFVNRFQEHVSFIMDLNTFEFFRDKKFIMKKLGLDEDNDSSNSNQTKKPSFFKRFFGLDI